ncbi:hypothetical protein C0J52_02864, partial [Blattella germanica]
SEDCSEHEANVRGYISSVRILSCFGGFLEGLNNCEEGLQIFADACLPSGSYSSPFSSYITFLIENRSDVETHGISGCGLQSVLNGILGSKMCVQTMFRVRDFVINEKAFRKSVACPAPWLSGLRQCDLVPVHRTHAASNLYGGRNFLIDFGKIFHQERMFSIKLDFRRTCGYGMLGMMLHLMESRYRSLITPNEIAASVRSGLLLAFQYQVRCLSHFTVPNINFQVDNRKSLVCLYMNVENPNWYLDRASQIVVPEQNAEILLVTLTKGFRTTRDDLILFVLAEEDKGSGPSVTCPKEELKETYGPVEILTLVRCEKEFELPSNKILTINSTPPHHFHKDLRTYLDNTAWGRWIERRIPKNTPQPTRSSDLTPLDFNLSSTQKCSVQQETSYTSTTCFEFEMTCVAIPVANMDLCSSSCSEVISDGTDKLTVRANKRLDEQGQVVVFGLTSTTGAERRLRDLRSTDKIPHNRREMLR